MVYSLKPHIAYCTRCKKDIVLSKEGERPSTSKLHQHDNHNHIDKLREEKLAVANFALDEELTTGTHLKKPTLASFGFVSRGPAPDFHSKLAFWLIATYQPNDTVENPEFRAMCFSLNPKVAPISKPKHAEKLLQLEADTKATVIKMLQNLDISLTADGWTSSVNKIFNSFSDFNEFYRPR
jgi:hypothetical protein